MKYFLILFSIILVSFTTLSGWNTNIEIAKKKASEQDKYILLNFSGSDWCGNCIKLERELFSKDTFKNFAQESLVLLNADFPTKKKNKLSAEQTSHNEKLAEKFNPNGEFPKTIILNSKGEFVGEMKHPSKNVSEYLESIHKIIQ
jgi:thioredoxin-related protein